VYKSDWILGSLFICTLVIEFFGVWCKAISINVLFLQHVAWWCSRLGICVWKHVHFVTFEVLSYWGSQDSIVAIASCYRLDNMGFRSWWGQYFLDPSRLAPGPSQPLAQWVQFHFPGGYSCWGVSLTTHRLLTPCSCMGMDIPRVGRCAHWSCNRTSFPVTFMILNIDI
jgi:hypothetical protein